jgi:GT2 family glycosyltransferase
MILRGLLEQRRKLDGLVVIDNEPNPSTEANVRASYADASVEYIPTPENLGPAGGIALGMRQVLEVADDGDWVLLVDDNDPPYAAGLLGDLEKFGETMLIQDRRTAAVGVVGARFDWRRCRLIGMGRLADGQSGDAVPVDVIGGGHFPIYRVGAIRTVGPFSPELFWGFEELEYGLRLRRAGFSLYANRSLWQERATNDPNIGADTRASLRLTDFSWRRYYELRNLLHILRSFHRTGSAVRVSIVRGIGKPLANLVFSPRTSMKHLEINAKACRDAWMGRMGRTVEPETADGYVRPWRRD